jgi:hypothetical protein
VLVPEGVAGRRAVERLVERREHDVRLARPAVGREKELGAAFGAEAPFDARRRRVRTSASRPATTSTCELGKPAQVTNAAPCARRQLSQWQWATKRDGKRATKRTVPQWHPPVAPPVIRRSARRR